MLISVRGMFDDWIAEQFGNLQATFRQTFLGIAFHEKQEIL